MLAVASPGAIVLNATTGGNEKISLYVAACSEHDV
jgi:hypothetical protein